MSPFACLLPVWEFPGSPGHPIPAPLGYGRGLNGKNKKKKSREFPGKPGLSVDEFGFDFLETFDFRGVVGDFDGVEGPGADEGVIPEVVAAPLSVPEGGQD